METRYFALLLVAGLFIALVVWLPVLLKRLPLSVPVIGLLAGAIIFTLADLPIRPLPYDYPVWTERLSEFVVIIALMGAGLKLDRPFGWRRWRVTWRLLAITMPISIAAIALLGIYGLGLSLVAAILLGGTLAPTDPVLAADVQVGPPRTGEEDEVRFGLTSEAGLNDGLAFPFVNLALVLAASAISGEPWFWKWLGLHVAWEIGVGVIGGWLIGRGIGILVFRIRPEAQLSRSGDGLIALATTLLSYALVEMAHGYGFLAVFIAALTLRDTSRNHDLHEEMHDLVGQIERVTMMLILVLFGGALVSGLLTPLGWMDFAIAAVILLIVRPAAGMIGLIGLPASLGEKLTIAFFGIRGIGSFYYLAYALNHTEIAGAERLWAIVGMICLISIILHGLTVTPLIRLLDRTHGRDPDAAEH